MRFVEPKTAEQQARAMAVPAARASGEAAHRDDQRAAGASRGVRPCRPGRDRLCDALGEGRSRTRDRTCRNGARHLPHAISSRSPHSDEDRRAEDEDRRRGEGGREPPAAADHARGRADHGAWRSRPSPRRWRQFRRGRDFAAWLGLVPRQHSTGRQAAARQDVEDGAARHPTAADHRSDGGGALGQRATGRRQGSWLARMLATQAADWWWRSRWPTRWRAASGRC